MNVPSMLPIFSKKELSIPKRTSLGKDEEAARKIMMEKPGQTSRELNPYWKNGGTGLPPEKPDSASSSHDKKQKSNRDRSRSRSRERKRSRSPRVRRQKSPQAKPRFRRPSDSEETRPSGSQRYSSSQPAWKKTVPKSNVSVEDLSSSSSSSESENEVSGKSAPGISMQHEDKIWTEQELNALNAKIIKAEIMGQQVNIVNYLFNSTFLIFSK